VSDRGRRVLLAGIGNVFLGDDAFGVEVARRLLAADLPDRVDVAEFGIGGVHLAYELLEGGWASLVLIDAMARAEEPGTLSVLDVLHDQLHQPEVSGLVADAHGMGPDTVLALLGGLGAIPERVLVVGCEPARVHPAMALSPPVAAAVSGAVKLALEVAVDELRRLDRPAAEEVA
jgi:hydrogenase maturation protease